MREDFHHKFLIGILILLDQSKKNHTKSNLMYLCIFMLLSISASRELAMTLNEPFKNRNIKFDMPEFEEVTFNDLIFLSIYKLIQTGPRLLKPIYKSIIAIIANLAPYTKTLCREACDGLMYLVQVFSKKEFLLEKEDNCRTLTALFESINYILAYHDESNQHLQIQLMKNQQIFDFFDSQEFEFQFKTMQQMEEASSPKKQESMESLVS